MAHNSTDSKNSGLVNNVIELPRRSEGMIDVYLAPDGQTGIDAVLPQSLAFKMLSEIMPTASQLYVCQPRQGGNVAIDVQVPASVAAKGLAVAKLAGIPIRR